MLLYNRKKLEMEELADAIEDAQYVNAISTQDNGPRPVLPWEKPTADELLIWEEAIQDNYKNMKNTSNSNSTASQPFSMEWCCQQPIGYFLFSQYVKDVYDDYPRMNFCEQVCRFQKCQLVSVRMELAAQIARDFLGYQQTPVIVVANQPVVSATATAVSAGSHVKVDATADVTDEDPATPEELEVKAEEPATAACKKEQLPGVAAEATHEMVDYLWPVPPRTEIEEYDLARPGPAMPSLKTGNHLPNDGSKSNPTVPSNSGFSLNSCQNLANIKKLPSWLSNKFSIAEKTTQELQSMYTVNMDFPICSESVVGVKGPILKDITKLVEEMETAAPPQAKSLIREEGPASDFSSRDNHVTRRSPRRSGSGSTQRSHATMDKHERVAAALEALGTSTKSIRNSSHSHTSNSLGLLPGSNHSTPKYGPADTSENFNNEEDDDDNEEFRSSPTTKSKFSRPFSRSAVVSGNVSKSVTLPNDLFEKAEYVAMESLRRQYWDGFVQSPYWIKLKNFLWYQDRRVLPEDFFVLRVLGRGGFGLVTGTLSTKNLTFENTRSRHVALFIFIREKLIILVFCSRCLSAACKRGTSGKLYAMKVMNKRRIKMKRSEVLALSERKALAAVESKFVINLKYSFHSKDDVFLILDLMTGGDLGFHLHQRGRFSKKECLYFAARIMLGLGGKDS